MTPPHPSYVNIISEGPHRDRCIAEGGLDISSRQMITSNPIKSDGRGGGGKNTVIGFEGGNATEAAIPKGSRRMDSTPHPDACVIPRPLRAHIRAHPTHGALELELS